MAWEVRAHILLNHVKMTEIENAESRHISGCICFAWADGVKIMCFCHAAVLQSGYMS